MLFPLPGVLKNAFPRRTREILNSLAHLTVFASAKEQGVNCNPTKVKHLFFDFIIKNHECRSVLIYPGTWLSTESRHKNTHSAAFLFRYFRKSPPEISPGILFFLNDSTISICRLLFLKWEFGEKNRNIRLARIFLWTFVVWKVKLKSFVYPHFRVYR